MSLTIYCSADPTAGEGVQVGDYVIVELVGSSFGDPVGHWTLDWGDGGPAISGDATSYAFTYQTYAAAGDYTVSATSSTLGTASVTAHILPTSPHLTIATSPTTTLPGAPMNLNFYGDYPEGDANSYEIDFGDGDTASASGYYLSLDHTYGAIGDYTIAVTLTNSRGVITRTETHTVVAPPPGYQPDTAVEISGIAGQVEVGPFGGVDQISNTWSGWDSDTIATYSGHHLLWTRWTAPASGTLVLHVLTPTDDDTPEGLVLRASDFLSIANVYDPGERPYNLSRSGAVVTEGEDYYILVGNRVEYEGYVKLRWSYASRDFGGPCWYVGYGFAGPIGLEAVCLEDPSRVAVVGWWNGDYDDYPNSMSVRGDKVVLSPDRFGAYGRFTQKGLTTVVDGQLAEPTPSLFFDNGRYHHDCTGNRGQAALFFPDSDDVLVWDGDPDVPVFRRINEVGDSVQTWTQPDSAFPAVFPGSPSDGDAFQVYNSGLVWAFWESARTLVMKAERRVYTYSEGSHAWSPDYSVYTHVVISIALNNDGTSTLTELFAETEASYSLESVASLGTGFVTVMEKDNNQYLGGVWITLYDDRWTQTDRFEFRPFPVLPRDGGYGSEDGWRNGQFFNTGWVYTIAGDDDYIWMTNNAGDADGDNFWSFIFKIPVHDVGGSRYAAMRKPWAAWKTDAGEIAYLGLGTISDRSAWAAGRSH